MPVLYTPPASIECIEARIKTRSIDVSRLPVRKPEIGLVFPFKLDRNAEAHIKKALKEYKIDKQSMLNEGDGIEGEKISGFSVKRINQDRSVVKTGSGTHKASFLDINSFVYAKLELSYRGIRKRLQKDSERLPPLQPS